MLALMERTLTLLDRANRRLGRMPDRTAAQQLGMDGERSAYFFLRRRGYLIVARRWRHALLKGEVDLIAWEGETLCFVEVKTRGSKTPFAAEFRVDGDKAEALHRMADAYVRMLPWRPGQAPSVSLRFDVVSVYLGADGPPDIRMLRDFLH